MFADNTYPVDNKIIQFTTIFNYINEFETQKIAQFNTL